MRSRKSTTRAKLKAPSQEEQMHLWKQHFKYLLRNSRKVTDEPITKIISNPKDIKLGKFTPGLDVVIKKSKNMKAAEFDEIPQKYGKQGNLTTYDVPLRYCSAVYNQNTIDRWTKACILPFPQEKWPDLGIAKNHRGITLTYYFYYPSNIICNLLQGIWLHTQRKDGANTSGFWSPQMSQP